MESFSMKTPWTDKVDSSAPLPEYPRPQFERSNWTNLNGPWDYAIVEREAPQPEEWQGEIIVPFAVESLLSGVEKRVSPAERLWYRKRIATPKFDKGHRVLLHFGAVDWEAEIYVN